MAEREEELKSLLMRVKEESEKACLKLNIKKLRLWHPLPSLHGMKKGKNVNSDKFYFLGLPKSLQMVIKVMRLKYTCSLEGKL